MDQSGARACIGSAGIMTIAKKFFRNRLLLASTVMAFSALTTAFGMRLLIRFDETPGVSGKTLSRWPDSTRVGRVRDHFQILIFAHPGCSCTAATIEELAILLARPSSHGEVRPAITIIAAGAQASPASIPWWESFRRIGRAELVWDKDGAEARRFGARVSGDVFLFNARGELVFRGGLTGSRGHIGDNYGLANLAAALESGRPAPQAQPVFGCALTAENSQEVRQ